MLVTVVALVVSLCGVSAFKELSDTELIYARVVSRHGDRTPDVDELRLTPGIVASDDSYYPFGMGALTNGGKDRAYQIGILLRSLYDGFLNDTYLPAEIGLRATAYDRTRMTLLCAMAALYPPVASQSWSNNLHWQPIPYNTEAKASDPLVPSSSCPKYVNAMYAIMAQLATDPDQISMYGEDLQNISERSGIKITDIVQITSLVGIIQGNENYGISKPSWAEELWPLLKELEDAGYQVFVQTDEMKRLAGGKILQDFIDISNDIVSGGQAAPKLDFVSGHDSNVIGILSASRVVIKPHRPKYTSTFCMELRKNITSGEYGVATVYARSADEKPELLLVDGCSGRALCPLDTFIELTAKYAVTDYEADCAVYRHDIIT